VRPPTTPPPGGPAAGLLDVYIVGGESQDANVQLKLAGMIAQRYRVPAPAVADGLAGGACLMAARMKDADARKLADELRDLGALCKLQAAGVPLRLTIKRAPDAKGRVASGTNPESFDRISSVSSPMQLVEMGARIETSVRQAPAAAQKRPPAAEVVRCPIHGLSYDRATASGCIRCLQPAREAARAIQAHGQGLLGGDLRSNPVKRALVGLALAVVVGALPAIFYTRAIVGAEVKRLRARQAELSDQLGTKAVTDEFDTLDAAVVQVRSRGLWRTMVLWMAVSGVTGLAWQLLSPARDEE